MVSSWPQRGRANEHWVWSRSVGIYSPYSRDNLLKDALHFGHPLNISRASMVWYLDGWIWSGRHTFCLLGDLGQVTVSQPHSLLHLIGLLLLWGENWSGKNYIVSHFGPHEGRNGIWALILLSGPVYTRGGHSVYTKANKYLKNTLSVFSEYLFSRIRLSDLLRLPISESQIKAIIIWLLFRMQKPSHTMAVAVQLRECI